MPEQFSLLKDFAVIMVVAGGALVLFAWLKQPPILAYLLAGFVIGPFTLPTPLVQNVEIVQLLANLGLVLLMFALGVNLGWERIRQVGPRVLLIASIEIGFMIAVGYEVGILLGWSVAEAIFLGAALSMTSSAILVKVLRDAGKLRGSVGRLLIGISVVEDFAGVILLTVLSGYASTGAADLASIGLLAGKLVLFAAAALVFGALFAPWLMRFVARFRSQETLLITSLALCFGLASVGQQLGISAAAGAFLIGAVLGDSDQAEDIRRVTDPVRDVFAALFFVSIGMLIDISRIGSFAVPALIISAVFIVGKVIANTVGTFIAGHDGRLSLNVGMGMAQPGEFSLAIIKVGVDRAAIGSFLYPLITVVTAVASFVFPFLFRSADTVADFLEKNSPRLLRQYTANLSDWLAALRRSLSIKGELAGQMQRAGRIILLNAGIIVVLIAVVTFVLQFSRELSDVVRLKESVLGLVLGGPLVALCIPPSVVIWRALRTLTDGVAQYVQKRSVVSSRLWARGNVGAVLRDSILVIMIALLGIWALPLISRLFALGTPAAPVPILLLAGMVTVTTRTLFRIHSTLEKTFNRTFLGPGVSTPDNDSPGKV